MTKRIITIFTAIFLSSCATYNQAEKDGSIISNKGFMTHESPESYSPTKNSEELTILLVSYQPGSKKDVMSFLGLEGLEVKHEYVNFNVIAIEIPSSTLEATKVKLLNNPNIISAEDNGVSFAN
ncbi:TPA: hypothetical protein M2P60_001753 [Klebsiella pneumoniae]|nr:hypothetical protein [Klebsiella pneumoniae]